jgi:hypothetical protein
VLSRVPGRRELHLSKVGLHALGGLLSNAAGSIAIRRVGAIANSTNMALAQTFTGASTVAFDGATADVLGDTVSALHRELDAALNAAIADGSLEAQWRRWMPELASRCRSTTRTPGRDPAVHRGRRDAPGQDRRAAQIRHRRRRQGARGDSGPAANRTSYRRAAGSGIGCATPTVQSSRAGPTWTLSPTACASGTSAPRSPTRYRTPPTSRSPRRCWRTACHFWRSVAVCRWSTWRWAERLSSTWRKTQSPTGIRCTGSPSNRAAPPPRRWVGTRSKYRPITIRPWTASVPACASSVAPTTTASKWSSTNRCRCWPCSGTRRTDADTAPHQQALFGSIVADAELRRRQKKRGSAHDLASSA